MKSAILGAGYVFLFLPYGLAAVVGTGWVLAACAGLAAAMAAADSSGTARSALKRAGLAVCAYVACAVLVSIPLNRAVKDFEQWHAKGAGVGLGMIRSEAERALEKRATFKAEPDGDWVTYSLEPKGLASWNPLRRTLFVDLYVLHVRFDPATTLATEVEPG